MTRIFAAVFVAAIMGSGGGMAQELPTAEPPKSVKPVSGAIGANLAISADMAPMKGLELKPDIKPNVKPLHRRFKDTGKEELCSGMNTMKTDMGRGIPTAVPRACRGPIAVTGGVGFGGSK